MNRKRKAFTLVELLTVVTVGSSLMLMAVTLVHKTMLLSQAAREKCERTQAVNRFIDQLRRDMHAADKVEVESAERLTIQFSKGAAARTAVYSISEHAIAREATVEAAESGDNADLEKTSATHERLTLGRYSQAKFEQISDPPRIALTVYTELEQKDAEPRVDRRIEAVLPR